MKSKYRRYFKTTRHKKYNIEIRINNSEYIFMYCGKNVKDFDKKAKRIKSSGILKLIKEAYYALERNNNEKNTVS